MAKKIFGLISLKSVAQRLGILAVLGIAVHMILPLITDLENSWQVLIQMNLWAVGLAFAAQALSYLGSGYLLQQALAIAHQEVSIFLSTLIVFGAASVGMVAGGTVGSSAAIYRWTSGSEGSMEGATLGSLLPSLFNTLMLVLLSIFGLAHLILIHNLSQAQAYGFGATLLTLGLIISVAVLAVRYRHRSINAAIWFASYLARLQRKAYDSNLTRTEFENLFSAWDALWQGEWHKLALGAFLNAAFDILTLFFLFTAAGNTITPGVLVTGYGLPLLLGKMAFVIPGGVGVVESSMAALYNGLGIPSAVTVVVVLAYRLISFWVPSLSGFPIAAYLQSSKRESRRK